MSYPVPPPMSIDPQRLYRAVLRTRLGNVAVELDPTHAPLAVNNFVSLARDGFYDGVIFHRVVPGFVVQGGDPTGTGRGGPGYRFPDELEGPGRYLRGTMAMANAGPDTNGSQFFICLEDVPLPHAYTIFGRVVEGMDVVDAIAALPRRGERPIEDVALEGIEVTET